MQPMVLVYLPTKLGDFVRANVGKYTIHGAYFVMLMGTTAQPSTNCHYPPVDVDSLRASTNSLIIFKSKLLVYQRV